MARHLLTAKQERILGYLRSRIEGGLPPTRQEVAEELGIKTPTAWMHLKALERKGKIRIQPHRARGIELAGEYPRGRAVPVLGRIAAGGPFVHEQNREGLLCVDDRVLPRGEIFAVRVYGDSMVGAGVLEGDYVIAHHRAEVKHGDIVVASVAQETTIKRLWRVGRKWFLKPENRKYKRIALGEDAAVQAKVVALHRPRI